MGGIYAPARLPEAASDCGKNAAPAFSPHRRPGKFRVFFTEKPVMTVLPVQINSGTRFALNHFELTRKVTKRKEQTDTPGG